MPPSIAITQPRRQTRRQTPGAIAIPIRKCEASLATTRADGTRNCRYNSKVVEVVDGEERRFCMKHRPTRVAPPVPLDQLPPKEDMTSAQAVAISNALGNQCSVCYDNFETKETMLVISKCNHVFHEKCVNRWKESGGANRNCDKCPICRASLSRRDMKWTCVRTKEQFGESDIKCIKTVFRAIQLMTGTTHQMERENCINVLGRHKSNVSAILSILE